MACNAALDSATPSAPRARALAIAAALVEMPPRPGHRGDGRHRNILAENQRRGAGTSTPPVEDDVLHPDLQGGVNIRFNVLGRKLVTHRNAAGLGAHLVGEIADLPDAVPVRETRRGDRILAGLQPAHLGDFAAYFSPRQMPAGAGFGPLPALEMKGLAFFHLVPAKAKARRGQFVEITAVGRLLAGEHTALAGADARAGQFRAFGKREFGFLGQRAETHVRHEQRNVQS